MKKALSILLVAALLLSLTACGGSTPSEPEVLQEQLTKPMDATHYDWADSLPRMDGSTSTIPLESGIRAALFGTSIAEAELQVTHSSTYGSFENFISGQAELVFSVPWSEAQIAKARKNGIEPEMVPIAAEGFVFVVNAQNPVDSLTQQQLKDIYSGKITNWKEVGGNDAPIVAYQRNETSGSQNFMHTFMGDTPLMEPTTDFLPSDMGGLMDAVAYYDNAENAIGYSVYAYAADMYGNGNEIKFIHVDGVEPTKASMADGTYPLLGYNYAIFDAATPAEDPLRKLVEWLVTEEGQRAIQAAGYVPVHPVGEITETVIDLYAAVGTGKPKPSDFSISLDRYVVSRFPEISEAEGVPAFTSLTNTALQQEINDFIAAATEETVANGGQVRVQIECINGYLSVRSSSYASGSSTSTGSAIFDLIEGKRIAFSDLFFEGVDFVSALNSSLANTLNSSLYEEQLSTKRPFIGIPAGHDEFTLTEVIFSEDNLYFDEGERLPIRGLQDLTWLSVARDMDGVFDDTVYVTHEFNQYDPYTVYQPLFWERETSLLDERYYDKDLCDKVNATVRKHCESYTEEALNAWFFETFGIPGEVWIEGTGANLYALGKQYYVSYAYISGGFNYQGDTLDMDFWHLPSKALIDAATGEEVPYTALLKDGWQQQSRWYSNNDAMSVSFFPGHSVTLEQVPDLTDAMLFELEFQGKALCFGFRTKDADHPFVIAEVPLEYTNLDL